MSAALIVTLLGMALLGAAAYFLTMAFNYSPWGGGIMAVICGALGAVCILVLRPLFMGNP